MQQQNRPSWTDIYFSIAEIVSQRSIDPHTKVGAVLVKDGCVIGIGYNGTARQSTIEFDWNSQDKYDYVIHAEMNAVSNASRVGISCKDADIYVTHSPCHLCINILIQHGIKRIFFKEKYTDFELSNNIANSSGVKLICI